MVLIWWQITWYTWLYFSWDYGILISDTKNPYRGWWSQWISGGWNHWVLEIEKRWCFCWSYFTNKNLEVLNLTSLFWISIVVYTVAYINLEHVLINSIQRSWSKTSLESWQMEIQPNIDLDHWRWLRKIYPFFTGKLIISMAIFNGKP